MQARVGCPIDSSTSTPSRSSPAGNGDEDDDPDAELKKKMAVMKIKQAIFTMNTVGAKDDMALLGEGGSGPNLVSDTLTCNS